MLESKTQIMFLPSVLQALSLFRTQGFVIFCDLSPDERSIFTKNTHLTISLHGRLPSDTVTLDTKVFRQNGLICAEKEHFDILKQFLKRHPDTGVFSPWIVILMDSPGIAGLSDLIKIDQEIYFLDIENNTFKEMYSGIFYNPLRYTIISRPTLSGRSYKLQEARRSPDLAVAEMRRGRSWYTYNNNTYTIRESLMNKRKCRIILFNSKRSDDFKNPFSACSAGLRSQEV